jgi:hypothetical protein
LLVPMWWWMVPAATACRPCSHAVLALCDSQAGHEGGSKAPTYAGSTIVIDKDGLKEYVGQAPFAKVRMPTHLPTYLQLVTALITSVP